MYLFLYGIIYVLDLIQDMRLFYLSLILAFVVISSIKHANDSNQKKKFQKILDYEFENYFFINRYQLTLKIKTSFLTSLLKDN